MNEERNNDNNKNEGRFPFTLRHYTLTHSLHHTHTLSLEWGLSGLMFLPPLMSPCTCAVYTSEMTTQRVPDLAEQLCVCVCVHLKYTLARVCSCASVYRV